MNITGSCRVDREEQKVTLQGTTMRKYQWGMEVDEQCYNYKEQEWNEGENTKADKNEIHTDKIRIGQISVLLKVLKLLIQIMMNVLKHLKMMLLLLLSLKTMLTQ